MSSTCIEKDIYTHAEPSSPRCLSAVLEVGSEQLSLFDFKIQQGPTQHTVIVDTPVGPALARNPDAGDSPLRLALAEVVIQLGSESSFQALYEVLVTGAVGGPGTWIEATQVRAGKFENWATLRLAVLWHQRINGLVMDGRTQYHSLQFPRTMLTQLGEKTLVPAEIAAMAVRERLHLGDDFNLLNGIWLQADALWSEVFEPAIERARQFRLAQGILDEDVPDWALPCHKRSPQPYAFSSRACVERSDHQAELPALHQERKPCN